VTGLARPAFADRTPLGERLLSPEPPKHSLEICRAAAKLNSLRERDALDLCESETSITLKANIVILIVAIVAGVGIVTLRR
jgi:hypothetical protein